MTQLRKFRIFKVKINKVSDCNNIDNIHNCSAGVSVEMEERLELEKKGQH